MRFIRFTCVPCIFYEHGLTFFTFQGSIADAIIKKINSTGGIMTHDDLKKYAVNVSAAEKGTYMGKTVYTTHAPTSGPGIFQSILPF